MGIQTIISMYPQYSWRHEHLLLPILALLFLFLKKNYIQHEIRFVTSRSRRRAWWTWICRGVSMNGHGFGRIMKKSNKNLSNENQNNMQEYYHNNYDSNSFNMDMSDNDLSGTSPLNKSPWSSHFMFCNPHSNLHHYQNPNSNLNPGHPSPSHSSPSSPSSPPCSSNNALMGALVREQGHIYSLATTGDLLYTGSDSKNVRVWKSQREFSSFKSNSGLVKAIVISGERIFTGHQDGKIRVWKISAKNPTVHKRVGTFPTFSDYLKNSMKPSNYVEVKKHRNEVWLKHFDAISCLCLSEDQKLLYSASWDKTFKVWRISDSKCLESIIAHDDAVNSLVVGFEGLVFTGSADGTVKVWRREVQGKGTKHFFSQILLKQECAVTALAVNPDATTVYCGSSDGVVNFWERENHLAHGGALNGHKLAVLCLVTAGNLIFSGSADTSICVWRKMGGDHICLSLLNGHSGPVKCLAVQKDHESLRSGQRIWVLYSGSLDKSVKIWHVSEHAPPMALDRCSSNMPSSLPDNPIVASSSRGRVSVPKFKTQ